MIGCGTFQSTPLEKLTIARVGDRVKFARERMPYTIRARDDRFIICTKPFALGKTVIYTIVDLRERIRGTENLVFGMGAETDQDCVEMLQRLNGIVEPGGFQTEISHRNRVTLDVECVDLRGDR